MAIEYKWVLYTDAEYRRQKKKDLVKIKIEKKENRDIYFIDNNLKLWEWILVSEENWICQVRVKERISGEVKGCSIFKKDLRFEN